MTFDLVVRGGSVVDADATRVLDIGITDGRVTAIGHDLPAGAIDINADGQFVLPGGVDIHTHLDQVSAKGSRTADDFFTGTVSAAHGGTTTVMAFAAQPRGTTIAAATTQGLTDAKKAVVDVGVHLIVTDFDSPTALDELQAARDAGITTLKVFLTYERLRLADAALVGVLAAARDLGMQVMVHAEHHGMISWRTGTLVADGRTAPANHALAHSRKAEAAGVAEIAALAEYLDMPIYLVHLSSVEALDALRNARRRGVSLIAETCPHYLFLDESRLDAQVRMAVQSMCSPPLRGAADRDALWSAIHDGEIDVVSSDHAPYTLEAAKLPHGDHTTFTECANGIAGVELRVPLMVSEALTGDRIDLADVVRLCCVNPAKAAGVFPQKGSLQVGSDADLTIIDPSVSWVVSVDELHDAMDHTAYAGAVLQGRISTVVSAGTVVVQGAHSDLPLGRGRFLARRTTSERAGRVGAIPVAGVR